LLGLSATGQQYFSLKTNQPPATRQQYFSLRTNQHQPSATSQTNRLLERTLLVCGGIEEGKDLEQLQKTWSNFKNLAIFT
jgi:hypothetical protein